MNPARPLLDALAGVAWLGSDRAAVECVDEDGSRSLWILTDAQDDGGPIRLPEHEGLGPLPPEVRSRIARAPFRCGRTTRSGRPCRTLVARPGQACGNHRDRGATACALCGRPAAYGKTMCAACERVAS
jgi:hypothetical protein